MLFLLLGGCSLSSSAPPHPVLASPPLPVRLGPADRHWQPPLHANLDQAAWAWVREFAPTQGVSPTMMTDFKVQQRIDPPQGGGLLRFAATVQGVPVLESDIAILMDADLHPVAWSTGTGFGPALYKDPSKHWLLENNQALLLALTELYQAHLTPSDITSLGENHGWDHLRLAPNTLPLSRPVRLRKVLWPETKWLEPAYQMEIWGDTAWEMVIRASDGAVLRQRRLTSDIAFNYRVWADTTGLFLPADNPYADLTPHPTGLPDGTSGTLVAPTLVSMEGFNTNNMGVPDPWLEATATESSGNNVDAYVDFDGTDGYSSGDFRANITTANTFDYSYDTTLGPLENDDQGKATISHTFYVLNWLHDWYYDAGFTEVAGNAQLSNYGRGGEEGDVLLAELQDNAYSGFRNNANMSTPLDGDSPVMQMYLWDGAVVNNVQSPELDGGLDSTVVAHEWGHYLHHRLVSCGSNQCAAMSEGWGDFIALHLMLRDGDNLSGAFPLASYAYGASGNDPTYYGIRRAPYSNDPSINALSFRHITSGEPLPNSHPILNSGDNSEVHNAGEIWASALLDAYIALQNARDSTESFDDIRRRMSDIVVTGMALSPSDPTYTQARDALLLAAAAIDINDAAVMADAFAGRGMGSCAVSPDTNSSDFSGVVEDFGLSPVLQMDPIILEDGDYSCDNDGILDGGERGRLRFVVSNVGGADLSLAELQLSADNPSIQFSTPSTVLPTLAAWESTEITLDIELDRSIADMSEVLITARLLSNDACVTELSETLGMIVEADQVSASASTDSFEADDGSWTLEGTGAADIWSRVGSDPFEFSWVGTDVSGVTDTQLVSPDLLVSTSNSLVLSLEHRWSFETSDGIYWDAGVLMLSEDGGPWEDASDYIDPGYTGLVSTSADNPLGDQWAWVQSNPSWPAFDTTVLDFGSIFAGHHLRFAFRIGTDQAVGDTGWEIASIALSGIDNLPFPSYISQVDICNPAPIANAGPDQALARGATVRLDGSASADPWGDNLSYHWQEISTNGIVLDDSTRVNPTFIAPTVPSDTTLTFELTVNDGLNSSSDTVDILVQAPQIDTGDSANDSAGDSVTPTDDSSLTSDSQTDSDPPVLENPDETAKTGPACGCTTSSPMTLLGVLGFLPLLSSRRRRWIR